MCRVVYHPKYSLYNLGEGHPFSPIRTQMLIELLETWNIYQDPIVPEIASIEAIKQIHEPDYVEVVENTSKGIEIDEVEYFGLGTSDNPIVRGMALGARYQIGGSICAANTILNGNANKVLQLGGGFHHAHYNMAAGFCLYNDLAAAIKQMTNKGWYVLYLDIDVHHGDGVQELFYNDDHVLTISIHESGEYLFPGKGWIHELGKGSGRSLSLNVPIEPFSEGQTYFEFLDRVVAPALNWFKPNAMIVQSGADSHFSDPLADIMLTTHDYERIFKSIITLADKYCNGNLIFTLGGGYSPTDTPRIWALLYMILKNIELDIELPQDWKNKWEAKLHKKFPKYLHDVLPAYQNIPRSKDILQTNIDTMRRLMDSVAQYWI